MALAALSLAYAVRHFLHQRSGGKQKELGEQISTSSREHAQPKDHIDDGVSDAKLNTLVVSNDMHNVLGVSKESGITNMTAFNDSQLAEAQRLAQCGSWNYNVDDNMLTCSTELCNIFGVERDEISQDCSPFFNFVDATDLERVLRTKSLCSTEGVSFDIEYRITTSSGEKRIIHERGYSERHESGKIKRLFGTAQDITARIQAEQSLRENEKEYRYLFEHNPLPMLIWEADTMEILECNKEAVVKYGYGRSELRRMTIQDLRPIDDGQFPEEAELAQDAYGTIVKKVWKHKKKNGDLIFMDVTGHIIAYKDKRCVFVMLNEVTEKLKAQEEIRSSSHRLRELTRHLQSIREEERTRIAREIHDELGQQLTVLKIDVCWIQKRIATEEKHIQEKLLSVLTVIDETVRTIRRIASDLRPGILDDLGLVAALEWQSQEFEKRTGTKCECHVHTTTFYPDKDLSTNIFRVFQEALTNITRHARATFVDTVLEEKDDCIELVIRDNGVGFDLKESKSRKSWGLVGMKERALMFNGELIIESRRGRGTTVTLRVPSEKDPLL